MYTRQSHDAYTKAHTAPSYRLIAINAALLITISSYAELSNRQVTYEYEYEYEYTDLLSRSEANWRSWEDHLDLTQPVARPQQQV